ncbi:MAG: sortase [Chloroflexi bacterium]|nr:sortase [Chloroflexota bacterium]
MGGSRVGLTLLGGGVLLLAIVGAFFGYQTYIDVRYDDVTATVPLTLPTNQELFAPLSTAVATIDPPPSSNADGLSFASLYPGAEIAPQFWANPFWAVELDNSSITAGYLPPSEVALPATGLSPATLVRIPIIGLEIGTIELTAEPFGDGEKYAAPPFKLGIIPGQPNPGEIGNTWLFGHLESPIRGEGSVFRDLPKVHDLLRQGQPVYVIIDSADGSFLYQATEFRIMHRDDLRLWGSTGRIATLVSSWPRFKYDERVVVTTELVGVRLNDSSDVSTDLS